MKSETKILNKLLVCAYITIALLAINTIILFASNVKITTDNTKTEEKGKGNNTGEETVNTDYDVSMMDTINMDEMIKLFDSKKTQVIYLGRSTCGYCIKFLPVLQQAQKDYDYTTKYFDITTAENGDVDKLLEKDNKDEFLSKNYGATPMVLLVKDGKLKDTWVGYSDYDDFAQFLEKNVF